MEREEAGGGRLVYIAPGLFTIAIAVAIFVGTAGLRLWDGVTPGARFLPLGLAGAGLLLGTALLVSGWRGRDSGVLDLPDRSGGRRVLLALAALVAVALATPLLGMVPMIGLFMLAMLAIVLRQPLLPSLVTTVLVVALIEIVFVRWLAVPLPSPLGL